MWVVGGRGVLEVSWQAGSNGRRGGVLGRLGWLAGHQVIVVSRGRIGAATGIVPVHLLPIMI